MSYRLTAALALFFLVSGLWPQMVTSAPTPQQEDAGALAGLLEADSLVSAGRDDGKSDGPTEFRYGGWWNEGEPAKPPDIRARNQHPTKSPPEIHIIDNVNLLFTSFQDHAQHASSTTTSNTSSLPTPSPPAPTRTITPRSVDEDDRTHSVFNIVIQKEKTQKSAFIAPDVTWLRDLVPKVVDVVDKPDTTIKETIFSVMDKQSTDEDRQILVNVVKAQVDSEDEVPEILARLRNLMQTGEGVDLALLETRNNGSVQSPVIINVVIVNVLSVNVLNVIVPDPTLTLNSSEKARTPDSAIAEDSYIEALRESQRNRNQGSALTMSPPHPHHPNEKHHQAQPHHGPHVISQVASTQNGFYLTEVPTQGYVSTDRPLMAMEKYYLRSYEVELPKQQSINTADKQDPPKSESLIDRNVGTVKLPSGPYFTNTADKPAKIEILDVNKVAETGTNVRATPKPENRPLKVRAPGAISAMTNKATSAVRSQIRTIGFVAIPILAGLASTVNAWLPAMAQLGRRRRRRSMEYEQLEEDWQPNPKYVGIDDRRRAIQDAQVLALLMGKRYMNVSKESLQESIDNWKNRDQEAAAGIPPHTTDPNKLASTNRPLWFQFQRPNNSPAADSTAIPPTTTVAPSTVNRPIYYEEEDPQTNSNNDNSSPLFYSAASVLDDIVENREIVEYDDTENVGPSTSSSGSTSTEAADYEGKETQSEENVAMTYQEPVTPHIHILPDTSPSGDDFDIVANFVQAMMMNGNNKNIPPVSGPENREDVDGPENREDVDGPEHREDVDGPEHRENIFFVKAPSIVNTTKTSGSTTIKPTTGATRVPPIGSGSTLSLFAADPIMPNWTNTNDRVTNSPVTYVAIRAPPVQPSLSRLPSQGTTTTTQTYDYDIGDVNDGIDPMSNEQVSTPLQFHEDETGITFFVSKDVPSRITSTASSTAGLAETKPTSTGRPLSQWFSDPFENGLFVGSGTTNTMRPASSTSTFSTQPATRPSSAAPTTSLQSTPQSTILPMSSSSITQSTLPPGTRPTSTTLNSQSSTSTRPTTSNSQSSTSTRPTTSNSQSSTSTRPTTSNSQSSSPPASQPTAPMFNSQFVTRPVAPPLKLQPTSQLGNRPSASASKPQAGRPSSLLTMASFTAPPRQKPAVPPPVEVSNGMSKYTKVPNAVTTPPLQDLSTLTGDSSLVSATVEKNNILAGIVKGDALTSPLPQQSTGRPTTTNAVDETSNVNQLFGGYSSTSSTSRPVATTGVSSEELDTTLDNLVSQLEMDASGLVSTKRPIGGLHFINTSTDVVIINPYDVTPSSIFSPLQMESAEAEIDDDTNESSDAIVVDAEAGNQPDSVPAVSNLANFLFASSGSSSSGSSGSSASSDGSVSGAGVTSSTSASSVDPFAMFYTLGLASAGILALTLPIWVPLVVAKKKRRTGTYGPIKTKEKKKKIKNQYPAKKKKTSGYAQKKPTYGEPPPNHYKDLDEDLPYHDDDYPAVPPSHPTYHSTTVEDLYRNGGGVNQDYSDTDVDHYSTLYRDLYSSNSDDAFHDPGPLNSEDLYGPTTSTYYDGKKAARRRRSVSSKKFKQSSNKRFH
ncbi:hypothetical protein GHT06_009819 [Daphnia sinensis]|uniref:EOG090X01QX n=1 Tax=Daphnia sinensis TaxID=1820382 RepID=A0AAD5LNH2_9CRUS|nr:hypothetical protein GHT06_009819 [Daphnia sinensis]